MTLESSFFPFPSEIVIPPAGYLASIGQMNIVAIIAAGVFGSILGALINYYIAFLFGRPLIDKYGIYFFLSKKKFNNIEYFFQKHGEITTFVGRLVPGIRQYISFPAGLAKMNIFRFILFTAFGAGIWVVILAYIGYYIGSNIEVVKKNIHIVMIYLFPVLFFIVLCYIVLYKISFKEDRR